MLKLYFAPGSSSFAVHIALHEVGAAFESRPMSFAKHDMQSPAYLAINPEGKVPTLVIDGRPMTEVAGILYYLARKYPEEALLPVNDPENEARAISWMSFIASTLHPARRHGVEHTKKVYGIADEKLAGKKWALDRYSIADIHLFRLYWRYVGWAHPAPGTFPKLAAHYDRMMARPAVRRTCEIEAAIGYALPV